MSEKPQDRIAQLCFERAVDIEVNDLHNVKPNLADYTQAVAEKLAGTLYEDEATERNVQLAIIDDPRIYISGTTAKGSVEVDIGNPEVNSAIWQQRLQNDMYDLQNRVAMLLNDDPCQMRTSDMRDIATAIERLITEEF